MEYMNLGFYLRHFAGFLIQFGGGIFLCLLPFAEGAFCYPRRRVLTGCAALAFLSSALFPLYMGLVRIRFAVYWAVFANIYMSAVIVIFIIVYVKTLRVETIKKMVVLVLALFYAAMQYLLIGFIELALTDGVFTEVYTPLDLTLYAITAAIFLPLFALLMRRAVWEYLIEMETDSIRREFWLVLLITFLYFAMMAVYASGPPKMVETFWWWIIPPMVMAGVVLGIFYWRFFRESVLRKRESEERKALEIQKIQYENIVREMEQTRILRHDMRHSLNYLSDLLAGGDEESMKSYLSELTVQIGHRDTVSYCKNATVNGLLQYYVGMAADRDIQCRVRADCGDVKVSPVDLTILLGNLMENAIRACAQIEENRWITVEIGIINGSLLIQAANPCEKIHPSGRYHLDGSFLPAAAYVSDRSGGGYGLYSMERTAKKYGGNASFCYDEQAKSFTTRIRLDLYPA